MVNAYRILVANMEVGYRLGNLDFDGRRWVLKGIEYESVEWIGVALDWVQ
jgi:hypothetical protein